MKPSILLSATLFAFVTPAFAADPAEQRFEHEGITYVYSVAAEGERQIITGRYYPTGARFRLTVSDGRVTGRMNGTAINFRLSNVDFGETPEITLASR